MKTPVQCKDCRFYMLDTDFDEADPDNVGYCHRYAPRSLTGPYSDTTGDYRDIVVWPCVCGDDWCGEYVEAVRLDPA